MESVSVLFSLELPVFAKVAREDMGLNRTRIRPKACALTSKAFLFERADAGQKSSYVEISRARERAELVTDDAKVLKQQLEAVTG